MLFQHTESVKLYWQLLQLHHIMEALLVWVKYQQGHGHTPQNVKWPYLKFRLGTNVPAPNPNRNPYPNPPPPRPKRVSLTNKSQNNSVLRAKRVCVAWNVLTNSCSHVMTPHGSHNHPSRPDSVSKYHTFCRW